MDALPPVNTPIIRYHEVADKIGDNKVQKVWERQEMMCALLTELADRVEAIHKHFGIGPDLEGFADVEEGNE